MHKPVLDPIATVAWLNDSYDLLLRLKCKREAIIHEAATRRLESRKKVRQHPRK